MKIILKVCFSILFFSITINSFAQRPAVVQADLAFAKGDYFDAATLYKKAFSKEKNKVKRAELIFKVAESYRLTNDYKNQEVWFSKALKANNKDLTTMLRLADAKKMNGKYDEAIIQYTNFQKADPSDPRGELGIQACEQAQKWRDKPLRYRIENVSAINTKYSDFGVSYSNKDRRHIIFSSSRQESIGKNNDGWTGEKYQDMFESVVDKKGKWSSPKPLLEPVNSNASEGGSTLDAKGNDMYFTRCETEKGKIGVCDIYYTKRKGATWDDPKIVLLGPDSSTVGHPSLSADEQTIYFASDMPGGFGGKDIWITRWDKKTKYWGTPVNAGDKINTEFDEVFPFITKDSTLYFSSKGHVGMGGLDIFMATQTNGSFDEPVNMQYPVNTSHDDFAFVIDEISGERGYFSSDRTGGKGGDDIYSWYLPPLIFTVSGKVFDADTGGNIEGATIELFGSDGSSIPFKTDATGAYKFDLKPETSYKVSATMANYLNKYMEVSTVGQEQSKDFIGDFDFAMRSTLRAIELPEVYYDLAKWDLRPESNKALDGLVQTLNDNPTIVIEIGSHTDSRPIPMTNDTLSQRRAKSVVDYLIKHDIDRERLDFHGYGKNSPRELTKDLGSFKKGDVLDDAFINNLKSKKLKEEAHQLNRRTEFKVLRTNYVTGQGAIDDINLETSQSSLVVDSSMNQPVEDIAVAGVVTATEAPHSMTAEDSAKATRSGPGEIYVAKKGDTYYSVSKEYGMNVRDLKTLNDLKSEQLFIGMELKVTPGGDYTEFDKKFYIIEKGEYSWQVLAKKFDMKSADLKKLNKEVKEDQLRIGKRIRIAQ